VPAGGGRELLEQPSLADPGLAQHRHHLGSTGPGGPVGRQRPAQLIVAAVQWASHQSRRLLRRAPGKSGILAQEPVVEVLQLGAGVDTQLVAERGSQGTEPVQRLGLPAVAVASEQQLAQRRFRSGWLATMTSSSPSVS
jgi:hypothetical protein